MSQDGLTLEGTVKIWQEKKGLFQKPVDAHCKKKVAQNAEWKVYYCVVRKLLPNSDTLHFYTFKNEKLKRKWSTKFKPIILTDFFGTETGFKLEKESTTLAIICRSVVLLLAFDLEESLTHWNLWLRQSFGYGCQYHLQVDFAPPATALNQKQYVRMHLQDGKFCLTADNPPRIALDFDLKEVSRYGSVHNQFCFMVGRNAGPFAGSYRLITGQCDQIDKMFRFASENELHNYLCNKSRRIESIMAASISSSQSEQLTDNMFVSNNGNSNLTPPFYQSISVDNSLPLPLLTSNCNEKEKISITSEKDTEFSFTTNLNGKIRSKRHKTDEKSNNCACCRRRRDYMNQKFIDSLQYYYNTDPFVKALSMKSKFCDHGSIETLLTKQLSKSEPASPSPNFCNICDNCRSSSYKNLPSVEAATANLSLQKDELEECGSATFVFNQIYTPMSPATNVHLNVENDNYVTMNHCYPRLESTSTASFPQYGKKWLDPIEVEVEYSKKRNLKEKDKKSVCDLVLPFIKPAPVYSVEAVREKRRKERMRTTGTSSGLAGLPSGESSLPASWSSEISGLEAQKTRKLSMSPVDDNVFEETSSFSRSSPTQTGLDLDEVPFSASPSGASSGFKFGSLFTLKRSLRSQKSIRNQYSRPLSGSYSCYDGDGPESPMVMLCRLPETDSMDNKTVQGLRGPFSAVPYSSAPLNNPPSVPKTINEDASIKRNGRPGAIKGNTPGIGLRLPSSLNPPDFSTMRADSRLTRPDYFKKPPISAPPPANFHGGKMDNVFKFPPCSTVKSATVPGPAHLNYCELAPAKPSSFPCRAVDFRQQLNSKIAQNSPNFQNSPSFKANSAKTPKGSGLSYVEIDEVATKAVSKNSTARAHERREKSQCKEKC